jgi:hypothetical protein
MIIVIHVIIIVIIAILIITVVIVNIIAIVILVIISTVTTMHYTTVRTLDKILRSTVFTLCFVAIITDNKIPLVNGLIRFTGITICVLPGTPPLSIGSAEISFDCVGSTVTIIANWLLAIGATMG